MCSHSPQLKVESPVSYPSACALPLCHILLMLGVSLKCRVALLLLQLLLRLLTVQRDSEAQQHWGRAAHKLVLLGITPKVSSAIRVASKPDLRVQRRHQLTEVILARHGDRRKDVRRCSA